MQRSILFLFGILGTMSLQSNWTLADVRPRRDHSKIEVQKIPDVEVRSHLKKNKSSKHPPLPEPEESPIIETHLFNPSGTEHRQTQCKEIPPEFALCYDIGYTKMHLPNLRGHDSIGELVKQSNEWTPLLATRCHPEAQKFLCSVFAPVCIEDFSQPIPPCRSLCEAVRDGCSPTMGRFDYPWPRMLDCSQFPTEDKLCIPSEAFNTEMHSSPVAKICQPCRRKKIGGGFKKKLCSFDFIMKTRVKHVTYQEGNTKLILEKRSRSVLKWMDNLNSKFAKRNKPKKSVMYFKDGLNCTCDVLQDGNHAHYLVAGWYDNGRLRLHSITRWRRSDKKLSRLLRKKCSEENKR